MSAASNARVPTRNPVARVLIVDDNRDNLLTLGVLLRSEGYVVQLAKDGEAALRVAATFLPDLALIDLMLPGRSGFDVAHELQGRHGKECPVLIAITAHSAEQTQEHAESSGFHHFLTKPYDLQALLRLVESLDSVA